MKCFPQYSLISFHTLTTCIHTQHVHATIYIRLNNPRILLAHKALRHDGPDIMEHITEFPQTDNFTDFI